MIEWIFIVSLMVMLGLLYWWGFGNLPKEQWQIMAAVPMLKKDGHWSGLNLTWYGFFVASANVFAVAMLIILLAAMAVPISTTVLAITVILSVCQAGAKLIARVVEKKHHTFTVGGAVFLGMLISPWVLLAIRRWGGIWFPLDAPILGFMSAVTIAYAFGEGMGRLACISFGCCYGKPVKDTHPLFQRVFRKLSFTFSGPTKKIAYAHGLDGTKVVPVQGITAVLYGISGITGIALFLNGYYGAAFLETLMVTQIWRVASEFLRADHRGTARFSAYQVMAGLTVFYGILVMFLFNSPASIPVIRNGLASLWNPFIIFFLQGLWTAIFLYTGRSSVTGSKVSFHVMHERI
jgi:hypothetical protein